MPNRDQSFAVDVHPGELHFNSAHFITFAGTCENLHGHNFHVRIQAEGNNGADAFVVDFVLLNRLTADVCARLHDKVLLPGKSDEVELEEQGEYMRVSSYGKRFTLPVANCAVLPISNTTAEMLAWYVSESLLSDPQARATLSQVDVLQVAVEEADHQWGICRRLIDKGPE